MNVGMNTCKECAHMREHTIHGPRMRVIWRCSAHRVKYLGEMQGKRVNLNTPACHDFLPKSSNDTCHETH